MAEWGARKRQVAELLQQADGDWITLQDICERLGLVSAIITHPLRSLAEAGLIEVGLVPGCQRLKRARWITGGQRMASASAGENFEERLAALEEIVNRIVLAPPEGTLAGDLCDLRKMMLLTYGFPLDSALVERIDRLLLEYCGIRVHPAETERESL